jgi:hypothetical protein
MLAKAKLASSITFIVLASFTIVTYDHQNMFIIQATGGQSSIVECYLFLNLLKRRHLWQLEMIIFLDRLDTYGQLHCARNGPAERWAKNSLNCPEILDLAKKNAV